MKKTNKIISIILAMILAFSSIPMMAGAAAIDDDVKTVDALIQSDKLGNLISWLLTSLNTRKEEVTGTVLRLVFMLVKDETLQKYIGATNLKDASDEDLAKILVNWLNDESVLPALTKDLDGSLKDILKTLGFDLSSVNGVVKSLYNLKSLPLGLNTDLAKMNNSALKNVTVEKVGALKTVYALFQFLSDNTAFFKQAVKGQLNLGVIVNNIEISDGKTINELIKSLIGPDGIKKILCDTIELDYETYKSYTADQIVAVAFLKLLTNTEGTVAQADADKVMKLSVYDFLETYAGDIYTKLLLNPLNNDVKTWLVENLKGKDATVDKVFNWEYEFKADTFAAILSKGFEGSMVDQLNNAVITLLEVIIVPSEFAKIGLEKGGNDKLNDNLTKTFRYILPLIKDLKDLGADLSGFTANAVKNMSAEEMAVAVLKLFFKGWFKLDDAAMKTVDSAKTLEQLGLLAANFAISNKEWVVFETTDFSKQIIENGKVKNLDDKECIDLLFEMGMETAAKALAYNGSTTYFALPEDVKGWTGEQYLNAIVDWAIDFAAGIPASADILYTAEGKLDDTATGFDKLNLLLNSLADLSFINGCGNKYFKFDIKTMLLDKFLGNLLNFDIENTVSILAENEDATVFNKQINTAVIDVVDDLLTGIFEAKLPTVLGNVDYDDKLSASDARLVLRAAVGLENFILFENIVADVDHSGKIDASDARLVLRAAVGLENLA